LLYYERNRLRLGAQNERQDLQHQQEEILKNISRFRTQVLQGLTNIENKVKDIFNSIYKLCDSYDSISNMYLETLKQANSLDQNVLYKLADLYKISSEYLQLKEVSPTAIFEPFFAKLSSWAGEIAPIYSLLDDLFFDRKEVSEIILKEKIAQQEFSCTTLREGAVCKDVAIFAYNASSHMMAPLGLHFYRDNQLINKYVETYEKNPIIKVQWIPKQNCFITLSYRRLKFHFLNRNFSSKVLTSYFTGDICDMKYCEEENILFCCGFEPQLRIIKVGPYKLKSILCLNIDKEFGECQAITHSPSQSKALLIFGNSIILYDIFKKTQIQCIKTPHDNISLEYLPRREMVVINTYENLVHLYMFTGSGSLMHFADIRTEEDPWRIIPLMNENYLLITMNEYFLELYDIETAKKTKIILGFEEKINDVLYLQKRNKLLAIGESEYLYVLDVKNSIHINETHSTDLYE